MNSLLKKYLTIIGIVHAVSAIIAISFISLVGSLFFWAVYKILAALI